MTKSKLLIEGGEEEKRDTKSGLHKQKRIGGTHFDLTGLADDTGQPVELIHKGLELIHRQFCTVTTTLRAQTTAAYT